MKKVRPCQYFLALVYVRYNIRQGKTHFSFPHLRSAGPKQLCALAHLGCTRELALPSQMKIQMFSICDT